MQIVPLSMTQVNWPDYVSVTYKHVGHSPTRSLDGVGIKPGDPYSFLASLAELEVEGTDPRIGVLSANHTLAHVHLSFLCVLNASEQNALRNIPTLDISFIDGKEEYDSSRVDLMIISGTLLQWQLVIPMMLEGFDLSRVTFVRRTFFNHIYNWIVKFNLKDIFTSYKVVPLTDGTYCLEPK